MSQDHNWKLVWNSKAAQIKKDDLLNSLIKANGFDTGCGDYSSAQWQLMTLELSKILNITKDSKVLEIGCGSGALLHAIQIHSQAKIFGYDYSVSLISSANQFLNGEFKVSEALINPFDYIKFDFAISHSVFQYFPDQDYAIKTIQTMANSLMPGGKIALLDLNDAACENIYHEDRRKNYKDPSTYDEKYKNHPHLFYSKDVIKNALIKFGFTDVSFPQHSVAEYINSKFRFNIIGTKIA